MAKIFVVEHEQQPPLKFFGLIESVSPKTGLVPMMCIMGGIGV